MVDLILLVPCIMGIVAALTLIAGLMMLGALIGGRRP